MKTIRHLLSTGLLFAAASLFAAAPDAKPKTYALAGFSPQGKPSVELLEQAAKAVETRMAGMTLVTNPEKADHYVEVLFWRGSFDVYVDALPLSGRRIGSSHLPPLYPLRVDVSMERAEIARSEGRGR